MVDSVAVLIRGLSFIAMFQAVGGALFVTLFGAHLPVSGVRIRRLLRIVTLTAIALLLAKMAGFGTLLGFAAWNKLRLTPALLQNNPAAAPRLRRSLTIEYLIIAAVLGITAVMTGLYSPDTV
jgi:putative copper export protein